MTHTIGLAFDSRDPERLADFWAVALDYTRHTQEITPAGEETVSLKDPLGNGPTVSFARVPEGKSAKNRLHLDIKVSQPAELVARLVEVGATVLIGANNTHNHTVMQDPEGNEFCVLGNPDLEGSTAKGPSPDFR